MVRPFLMGLSCAHLEVTTVSNPTAVTAGWHTYTDLETGVAINLPDRHRPMTDSA